MLHVSLFLVQQYFMFHQWLHGGVMFLGVKLEACQQMFVACQQMFVDTNQKYLSLLIKLL